MQNDRVGRDILRKPDVTADDGVMTDGNAAQDRSIRIDGDMVFENRVTRDI